MAIGSAVCRVCLAGDGGGEINLLNINNQLLDVYEKLTNVKMSEGEGRLCYICLSQLQRCWRFAKTAKRSESYMNTVLETNKKIKGDTVNNMLKLVKLQTLSVKKLRPVSLDGSDKPLSPKSVKNKGKIQDNGGFFIDENETHEIDEQIILVQNEETLGKEIHINREITKIKKDIYTEMNNEDESEASFEDKDLSEVKDCIIITKMYYECGVCDKILESQNDLAIHQNSHMESKETYPEEIKESYHIPVANKLKPDKVITKMYYECGGCSKILQSQEDLAVHQNSHTEHNTFHHNLLNNTDNAENNEANKLKAVNCSVCRKYFNDTAQLYQHFKMHTGKRPFICDTCGKTFRTRCHLKAHFSIHTMEKVYCKICNKGFSQTSSLGRHMLLHTGEYPFFCHICGRRFKQSGQLRMHIRTVHERIKDHECEVCNKRFSVNAELQRHMVCHSGLKPFECENCGVKVTTKTVLRRHKLNHCKKI